MLGQDRERRPRRKSRAPADPLRVDATAGHHYDTSNEFYRLWLDPSLTYSCAYYEHGTESLEAAQRAKIDVAFRKVGLQVGHRLLDVGCGWGAAVLRAVQSYGATAVGLTLSAAQFELARERARNIPGADVRLQAWETFDEPCDRIVSFGAFEHFTVTKYPSFFERCRRILPPDGRLLVQTITVGKPSRSFALLRFAYFLHTEFFFEAELPRPEQVIEHARQANLELLHAESLRPHYPRTIHAWLANLRRRRDEAVRLTDQATYDKYVRYLEGSARYHASGETGVYQFLFAPV